MKLRAKRKELNYRLGMKRIELFVARRAAGEKLMEDVCYILTVWVM